MSATRARLIAERNKLKIAGRMQQFDDKRRSKSPTIKSGLLFSVTIFVAIEQFLQLDNLPSHGKQTDFAALGSFIYPEFVFLSIYF